MPTLNLIPSLDGFNQQYSARVREASFGDGYKQLAPDGLNTVRRNTSIKKICNLTQLNAYLNELKSYKGAVPFNWSPDGSVTTDLWVCPNWSFTKLSSDRYELSAEFVEYFG